MMAVGSRRVLRYTIVAARLAATSQALKLGWNRMEVDLNDLQRRVNQSRQQVQLAIERYDTEGRSNGEFIVKRYLRKFRDDDPSRAETAVKIAAETESEIDKFRIKGGDLLSKVATAHLQGSFLATSATVDGINDILVHTSALLTGITNRLQHPKEETAIPETAELEAVLLQRRMEAAKVGEAVILISNFAASVYNLQCDTLKGFRNDNLEVSREELIKRLQDMLVSIPTEEAFDRFRKLVQDLLAEYLKKVPVLGWLVWIAEKVKKLSRPKAGTAPGDTDIMLKLLPALRKDQQMIDELDKVYRDLMAEK